MCWKAEYVILIVVSTLIDYICGLKIAETAEPAKRKFYLALSLITNLGILFAFKYFNLFNDTARALLNQWNVVYQVPGFDVLLPVGISFYTFQSLSYTIDIYRGTRGAERHFGIFALYVSFFPQLVAGPIERSKRLLPQFYETHRFSWIRTVANMQLIAWGLFKKIVIADRLAPFVDQVYSQPSHFSGPDFLIATYMFAIQIFCDFSGYTDIAIGSAGILGFRLMKNFRNPYGAVNIPDFWRRWHISLTSWFKDYVYIPLGGSRVTRGRWLINVFVVFFVSGFWHGANWTFVVWGILHAVYYYGSFYGQPLRTRVVEVLGLARYPRLLHGLRILITFNLVSFAWIFFRANTLRDAMSIVGKLLSVSEWTFVKTLLTPTQLSILLLCFVPVILKRQLYSTDVSLNRRFRLSFLHFTFYALIANYLIFFSVQSYEAFIYFQF